MADQVHAPRRTPEPPGAPLDLRAAAQDLLDEAGVLRAGRSARTLTPGAGAPVKQTLLALKAGEHLQEHVAPGPTTLLGVLGTILLTTGEGDGVTLSEGVWAPCPDGSHALEAVSDGVLLLTVATAERDDA